MAGVTDKQAAILEALDGYVDPPSVRRLVDSLDRPKFGGRHWTYDQVRSSLERLVRRGFVVKLPGVSGERANRYKTSASGRAALVGRSK